LGAECIFEKGIWPCVYIAFLKRSSDDAVNTYFDMHKCTPMSEPTRDLEAWNSKPYLLRTYEFSIGMRDMLGFSITMPLWAILGTGAYIAYRKMH
jgi:hypothetical protein